MGGRGHGRQHVDEPLVNQHAFIGWAALTVEGFHGPQ